MEFRVLELLKEDGTSPYSDWFCSLDALAAAKVVIATLRVEQGNLKGQQKDIERALALWLTTNSAKRKQQDTGDLWL